MAKTNFYQYIIYAVNTNTKEENIVCKVRSFGDVPHIINGLQASVKTSPIKYTHKKI